MRGCAAARIAGFSIVLLLLDPCCAHSKAFLTTRAYAYRCRRFPAIARVLPPPIVTIMRQRSYRRALVPHMVVHTCPRTWRARAHIHARAIVQLGAYQKIRLFYFLPLG